MEKEWKKSYRVQILILNFPTLAFNSLPMTGKERFSLRFDMGFGQKSFFTTLIGCWKCHFRGSLEFCWNRPRLGKRHWRSWWKLGSRPKPIGDVNIIPKGSMGLEYLLHLYTINVSHSWRVYHHFCDFCFRNTGQKAVKVWFTPRRNLGFNWLFASFLCFTIEVRHVPWLRRIETRNLWVLNEKSSAFQGVSSDIAENAQKPWCKLPSLKVRYVGVIQWDPYGGESNKQQVHGNFQWFARNMVHCWGVGVIEWLLMFLKAQLWRRFL